MIFRIASRLLLAALFCGCILLGGCAIYLPGVWDSNYPASVPLRTSDSRLYTGVDFNYSGGYNRDESNALARAHYTWATGDSWWRLSAGGQGYGGSYHVVASGDSTELGTKSYGGLGWFADGNVAIAGDNASFGIGGYAGMTAEFGNYVQVWRGRDVAFVPLVGGYGFVDFTVGKRKWLGFHGSFGLPGLFGFGAQLDLEHYLIWTAYGSPIITNESDPGIGRITIGATLRL